MLKKMSIRKIVLASITLLLLIILYLLPDGDINVLKLESKEKLEYISGELNTHEIYLLDSNNFIARTSVLVSKKSTAKESIARELLETLIIDGKRESNIPSGFRAIIPLDTKIVTITLQESTIKVNFSKELLDVTKDYEEKMIEAITYTLTSIDGVEGVLIYVENELLTVLPKKSTHLPTLLTREFGVNKVYDLSSTSDINYVTVYYINKYNKDYYYVPVTKYVNDSREKIKIIIDELASGPTYESNLMSFLNANTKLLNYEMVDNIMKLDFNPYILSSLDEKKILEEVIYTISLSLGDNYDIAEVVFNVEELEITKKCLKDC